MASDNHVSFERMFVYALETSNVVIIQGKEVILESENLPLYIYNAGFTLLPKGNSHFTRKLAVAQPRISNTQIQRLSRLLNNNNIIGYMESLNFASYSNVHIVYTNYDILIKKLLIDPLITEYSVIIIEDVNKRSVITDTLISLLTSVMSVRNLRLVLTVCSGNSLAFTSFFKNHGAFSGKVTLLGSRSKPKSINYIKEPTPNYLQSAINLVYEIHKTENYGDILVFVPRDSDIDYIISSINGSASSKRDKYPLMALTPGDSAKKYMSLNRRVYVTNITKPFFLENIQFVIDSCLDKYSKVNSNGYLEQTIQIAPIDTMEYRSSFSSNKCYRLMPHESLTYAPRSHDPKVETDDITNLVLYLLLLGGNNLKIELLHPPKISSLENALLKLFLLNAIDENGKIKYPNAQFMSQLNFDPMVSAFLLQCAIKKCTGAGATICAMLYVKSELWAEQPGSSTSLKRLIDARKGLGAKEGDLFSLYNIYSQAMAHSNSLKRWAEMRLINHLAIKKASKVRSRIIRTYKQFNFEVTDSTDQDSIIRAMAASFFMNVARPKYLIGRHIEEEDIHNTEKCPYMLLNDKQSIFYIHPHSFIAHLQPQCVIFTNATYGDTNYIINVNEVDPKILAQEAPNYFNLSRR